MITGQYNSKERCTNQTWVQINLSWKKILPNERGVQQKSLGRKYIQTPNIWLKDFLEKKKLSTAQICVAVIFYSHRHNPFNKNSHPSTVKNSKRLIVS